MSFDQLRLSEPILRALSDEGYSHPTPIQSQAIPSAVDGRDLLGSAQTGTGKTAAFALPLLERLSRRPRTDEKRRAIRAIILSPTRELAAQIHDSFRAYGRHLPLRSVAIFGGVNQNPQVRALKAGVDVLIATPGRLFDLMEQGFVDLRRVEALVLDEADQMLDMGFIHDVRRIVTHIPKQRQTMLFSATMPAEIRRLADAILTDPVRVAVNPVASTVRTVEQQVYLVDRSRKTALLRDLLRGPCTGRTLVFTRTKHGADRVVRDLLKAGLRAQAIHGNKSQSARTRAMAAFKSSAPPVLVATDIAARGIDVDEIAHVINFDLPNVPETYVHRIGRTARAGASGTAVSFCDPQERGMLHAIERLTRIPLIVVRSQAAGCQVHAPSEPLAGDDGRATARPAPRRGWKSNHREAASRRTPAGRSGAAKPKSNGRKARVGDVRADAPRAAGKKSSTRRRNVRGRNGGAAGRGAGGSPNHQSSKRGAGRQS